MPYIIIAILSIVLIAVWLQNLNEKEEVKKRKAEQVPYDPNSKDPRHHFRAAEIALRENNVMIWQKEDGVYVRLAGNPNDGEAFRYEWGKVIDFSKNPKDSTQPNSDL